MSTLQFKLWLLGASIRSRFHIVCFESSASLIRLMEPFFWNLQARSTTFLVEYYMPGNLLCLHVDAAKSQLAEELLASMQKAGDVEEVFVNSINVPPASRMDCHRRSHKMARNRIKPTRLSRALLSTGVAAKIDILV